MLFFPIPVPVPVTLPVPVPVPVSTAAILVSNIPTMEVKSVGTFPVILLKLATPPLPLQTKLNLDQNGRN